MAGPSHPLSSVSSGSSAGPVAQAPDRVEILGLPVDRVDMTQALAKIEGFLQEPRPHLVITADASGMAQAQGDEIFRDLFFTADLITPDSVGVLWASKRYGKPLAGRVSGVELVGGICEISARTGARIFLLGAAPGVAALAAEKLRLKHPGCNIVGARVGYFPASDDTLVAAEIAETMPDVLFVAMGIPRQEKFIRATEGIIGARVSMGVGGSLDVHSGTVRRAPKLFQTLHIEWLWRTLANPKKIAKAKNLPVFVRLVLKDTKGR